VFGAFHLVNPYERACRTDLPALTDLRREWDLPTEPDHGDTTAD
jgi:hypothetical protein